MNKSQTRAEIIFAFRQHRMAHAGHFWTDGSAVYSYAMRLAWFDENGDVQATTKKAPTHTTAEHLAVVRSLLVV